MQPSNGENTLETITQDQLDAMVRLHARYLEGRLGGRRASLKNTNISNLSLKDQDLRQSSFMGCVMVGWRSGQSHRSVKSAA